MLTILGLLVRIAVQFLGVPFAFLFALKAYKSEDPTRLWVIAGALFTASILLRLFSIDDEDEGEEGDVEDGEAQ